MGYWGLLVGRERAGAGAAPPGADVAGSTTNNQLLLSHSDRQVGHPELVGGLGPTEVPALEKLVSTYLWRDFHRGGGLMRIDRLLVDVGYKPGIVAAVKHKVGGSNMMLSKGLGIRASRQPMSTWKRRPGETHGHFWYVPNVNRTAEPACRRQVPAPSGGRELLEDVRPHRPGHGPRRPRQPDALRQAIRPRAVRPPRGRVRAVDRRSGPRPHGPRMVPQARQARQPLARLLGRLHRSGQPPGIRTPGEGTPHRQCKRYSKNDLRRT